MMTFLSDFHLDGPFGQSLNTMFVLLVPRKGRWRTFRLISLVSCINKLLVKILVCDPVHNPHC